jgi:xanthine dehydrogenase small subunit
MEAVFECIINNTSVKAAVNPGIVLLDYLRQHEHLTGTKEGCREGDCGACTVLVGEVRGTDVVYTAVNSCLLPLGDVNGKHVVTIEGLNLNSGLIPGRTSGQPSDLTPIQHAFVEEGGTQCGFCTPGFIVSLTGYCLTEARTHSMRPDDGAAADMFAVNNAITAVDGNICRCTGHSPIKRAIRRVTEYLAIHPHADGSPLEHLVAQKILPEYFLSIASRLNDVRSNGEAVLIVDDAEAHIVSGGTDLYVQKAFTMHAEPAARISSLRGTVAIAERDGAIHIPGATTIEEFRCSPIVHKYFPTLESQLLMFGSTPIRNRATIAGNLANASPIGDMICLFMAMDATLTLRDGASLRTVALRKFYTGYKQLDKKKRELIASITIAIPGAAACLSYEKVSRRRYLDIASVNSAMQFDLCEGGLSRVGISAGGVGPTMVFLKAASGFLDGKTMDAGVFEEVISIASEEISPISDARGSADYKRMLLRQLLAAHVMKYFPGVVKKEMFS